MIFKILGKWDDNPKNASSQVFLTWDDWNDYSFLTLFGIFYVNANSEKVKLGKVKIGYFGQKESERRLSIGDEFTEIGDEFFSVGVDVEYYEILNQLGEETRDTILKGLHDIALDVDLFEKAILENVTKISLLRSTSETTITGQFRRLAQGGLKLTSYDFKFIPQSNINAITPFELSFAVKPYSNPPSNIHILIGRNGVGKTFIINNMIDALTKPEDQSNQYGEFISQTKEKSRLFANLVCVTFSAFDDFEHPPEQRDKSAGIQYSYIGLKSVRDSNLNNQPKSPILLKEEFVESFFTCINNSRINRWKSAIKILESDPIFKSANIFNLFDHSNENEISDKASSLFKRLSSGHKIVLLTITRLVETVQERSLVLFDEPESHLHPPLLSSFIRAVSDLLINRNGVGIIATHSPVILQEVPKSCVWKLRRNGAEAFAERLEIESFGENVGVLTQEVFGLEVTDSGFHKIIKELVRNAHSYEDAVEILNDQIGLEAKAILRSLFFQKNKKNDINS
jgi:ABC-type branched-subunit amino acid transport system ATPase component